MGLRGLARSAAARAPLLEVLARSAYFRTIAARRATRRSATSATTTPRIPSTRALDALDSLAAAASLPLGGAGRTLLVHSSFDAISLGTESPKDVLRALLERCGAGTLAMPAIPMYREFPDDGRDLREAPPTCDYDPRRTPPWTGLLPFTLMRTAHATRSLHPLNSMAALGPDADAMMRHNLDGREPTPHGTGSSWEHCYRNDATVVFLGAEPVDSMTIIHVAEDLAIERGIWPIEDWYRRRPFRLHRDGGVETIVVRERQPRYRIHFAEQALDHALRSNGILVSRSVDGVPIAASSARAIVDLLLSRAASGFPFAHLGLRGLLSPPTPPESA